jgi:ABC-type bacteriocin/lantibiotic exporter with double-glycine peptidase domain
VRSSLHKVAFTNCKPIGKLCFIFSKRLTLLLLVFRINTEETIVNYTIHNSTDNDIYKNNTEKRHQMVYLIPLLTLLVGVLIMVKATIFFLLVKKASLSIHKIVVGKIIGASIEFFDSNLVGNIFNKLSEDLLYIDEKIPISLSVVLEVSFVSSFFFNLIFSFSLL